MSFRKAPSTYNPPNKLVELNDRTQLLGRSPDTYGSTSANSSDDDEEEGGTRHSSDKRRHHHSGKVPQSPSSYSKKESRAFAPMQNPLNEDLEFMSDYDSDSYHSADDFRDKRKAIRTSRQRKKSTARTKGGEFQAKRKKRRVYFCCVSREVDLQKLHEHVMNVISGERAGTWSTNLFGEALHISNVGNSQMLTFPRRNTGVSESEFEPIQSNLVKIDSTDRTLNEITLSNPNSKELYVFEFGAVVLWGFTKGEEVRLLNVVRDFSSKVLDQTEFEVSEDDIAFVTSSDIFQVAMSNDVISLPENSTVKQRLAVSFAIAQSTVLSLFENRIDCKVADYKYIPESLATSGKIQLSMKAIGMMIGEIFVIRHDLNLHTYILDVPDFFWEENKDDSDFALYKTIMRYLEMDGRVEVLNKRLDMLKELLDMLQQQMENDHATKLEWIVIWLIVAEVLIEVAGAGGALLGFWTW